MEPSAPNPTRHGQGRRENEWVGHGGAVVESAGKFIDNEIERQGESRTKPATVMGEEREEG